MLSGFPFEQNIRQFCNCVLTNKTDSLNDISARQSNGNVSLVLSKI